MNVVKKGKKLGGKNGSIRGTLLKRVSDNAVYKARNDSRNIKVSGREGDRWRYKGVVHSRYRVAIVVIYAAKGN